MATHDHDEVASSQDLYTALARTITRAITLYFSRPVRLFRPSKVSGWHSLRVNAKKHGTTLSPQYIISVVKSQGVFMVIHRHFVPPMLANAVLGTVLWTTYTECSGYLQSHLGVHSIFTAALSGACAGGMQALIAVPIENVKLVLEGGTGKEWSHAWKEVFRGTQPTHASSRSDQIRDIRQVRFWMKDVGKMAGRGWAGWGWECGKDVCGFSAFFAVFEITRKAAKGVKAVTHHFCQSQPANQVLHSAKLPRFTQAFTLVCGGVMAGLAYEHLTRPWDVARRTIALERSIMTHPGCRRSSLSVLTHKLRGDGITSFFRGHSTHFTYPRPRSDVHLRTISGLRTLGRVGPWGVAFLVWESFGPGLD